jgi:hypothetical protein
MDRRGTFTGADAREDIPDDTDGNYFPQFSSNRPIRAAARDDGLLADGMPALFTGAPTRVRYGEPAALLGGRMGRLIGDPSRWSMDAWALIRKDPAKIPPQGTLPSTYGAS